MKTSQIPFKTVFPIYGVQLCFRHQIYNFVKNIDSKFRRHCNLFMVIRGDNNKSSHNGIRAEKGKTQLSISYQHSLPCLPFIYTVCKSK